MRKSNELSLKEAIEQMLDQFRLRGKLNEVAIGRIWETTMGNAIAKRTERLYIRNEELHIILTSASLKNELFYQRDQIRDMINKELGGDYIKEVTIG